MSHSITEVKNFETNTMNIITLACYDIVLGHLDEFAVCCQRCCDSLHQLCVLLVRVQSVVIISQFCAVYLVLTRSGCSCTFGQSELDILWYNRWTRCDVGSVTSAFSQS